jgi:hypothetical protein
MKHQAAAAAAAAAVMAVLVVVLPPPLLLLHHHGVQESKCVACGGRGMCVFINKLAYQCRICLK